MEEKLNESAQAVKELVDAKKEIDKLNKEIDVTVRENEKLKKLVDAGGRDVDLEIDLDLEADFSVFRHEGFEFSVNLSRDQLRAWAEHAKTLIKEIHEELSKEVDSLSARCEMLEKYIESRDLPLPEDAGFGVFKIKSRTVADLPHPVPSMTMEELEAYNPSKEQLKGYINLMFNEWRRDEDQANEMIVATDEDIKILKELEPSTGESKPEEKENNKDTIEELRNKLELKSTELKKLREEIQ